MRREGAVSLHLLYSLPGKGVNRLVRGIIRKRAGGMSRRSEITSVEEVAVSAPMSAFVRSTYNPRIAARRVRVRSAGILEAPHSKRPTSGTGFGARRNGI